MKPDRWEKLDQIFHTALECAPAERTALLDKACAGDEALRSVLVVGATAVIRQLRRGQSAAASPWLVELLKRKPPKLAAVALANKIARSPGSLW